MIFPAAYYFLFYAAISALTPFLALYYQSLGLHGSQIGLLTGIAPLVTLFSVPFWTGTADASHRHKLILVIAIGGSVGVALIIPQLPSFAWLIPFVMVFAFISAPIISLVDSATMVMLGERRERYGRVRLWGTVGWAVTAPLAGEMIERAGLPWAFWLYAILMSIGMLVAVQIPFRQERVSVSFWRGMHSLLSHRQWMLFLLMVFVSGVGMATVNNYLFIYMGSLGMSKTLMGLALTISTISEFPILFYADRLLQRFNTRGVLVLAMGTTGLRLLLYSFTSLPWAILLIQLLHGMTFPMIWVVGVAYADKIAPSGMRATAQGMFGSMLMGVAAAAGGMLGGFLLDQAGPAGMYRIVGLGVLVSIFLYLALERGTVSEPQT